MKNPLTPAGIEPATFQFVVQHLNHCAIAVPHLYLVSRLRNNAAVPLFPLFAFMMWMVIPFNSRFLLRSYHSHPPYLSYQQTCPTAILPPFSIRTVQINFCKGFYNHCRCCRMYVLLHVLLRINDICQTLTFSMYIHCQCNT